MKVDHHNIHGFFVFYATTGVINSIRNEIVSTVCWKYKE